MQGDERTKGVAAGGKFLKREITLPSHDKYERAGTGEQRQREQTLEPGSRAVGLIGCCGHVFPVAPVAPQR